MPRRPRLVRLVLPTGLVLDIYDAKVLERLLPILLAQLQERPEAARAESDGESRTPAAPEGGDGGGGELPSFARDNPWLSLLSKGR